MIFQAGSMRRRAALLAAALLVATASVVSVPRPVAASAAGCDTVVLTAPDALALEVEVAGCGALDDASYVVTAEVFERRTAGLVTAWSQSGGGTAVLVNESWAVPVGGWYDLVVTSQSDGGGQVVAEASALVDDGGRVTIDAPVLGFRAARMSGSSYPAAVRWSRVGSTPAARYTVQRSIDGGPWAKFGSTRTTSIDARVARGHVVMFRVRGISASGERGPWRSTVTTSPRGYGDSSSSLVYGGTWRTGSNDRFWGDRVHFAKAKGRSVSLTFMGSAAAVVSTLGPNRGKFRVYVDDVYLRTVSTYSAGVSYRQVVYGVQWPEPGEHTIRLVVVGTTGHPRVDLDGFLVLRALP